MLDEQTIRGAIDSSDLRTEWYSGTGAGGQHRNKHQTSCRLKHLPSGIVVTAQCRSRENSFQEALSELQKRVSLSLDLASHEQTATVRREQVGSGERADKMRTYRFQEDRVVDHRTGLSASLRSVMSGRFDLLWP